MYGGHSQFDGNAAFSGGGFMPSQATQTTADPSYSPAKTRDSQPLTPLTVKQISEAFQSSDDKMNFLIDGVDVNNVKLVGMLFNKAERVTDVSFVIDDGTGRIDCFRWWLSMLLKFFNHLPSQKNIFSSDIFCHSMETKPLICPCRVNEAVDTKEMECIQNGMYVIVHGHLKGFQGKRQMMVYSVRPLTDYNEIAYHFSECIYVHCCNTRLRKLQDNASTSVHISNPAFNTPLKGYQASASNQFSGQCNMDGLKGTDNLVLDYLQQPQCLAREKGVHRNELAQQLNVPLERIREAIESLESEGLVYSTIDEHHYKSTANG